MICQNKNIKILLEIQRRCCKMGTSTDALKDRIDEQQIMLNYIQENYPQAYEEEETHYINYEED